MKIKLNETLFAIAYYPWVFAWMFTSTYLKDIIHPYGIINIWNYVSVLCVIIALLLSKKTTLGNLLIIPLLLFISFFVSKDNGNASFVFNTILLVILSLNLNFKRIVLITMCLQILSLGITVSLSLLNVIPNDLFVSTAGGFLRNRYGLGYTFPTFSPNYFFSIVIEYVYIRFGKVKWIEYIFITLLNVFFYEYTGTRFSFFLVFLILILERAFRKNSTFLSNIVPYFPTLMFTLTYLSTVLYSPENRILVNLNNILSQRLRFAKLGLETWGVKFFGTSVQWESDATSYNYIDSSYINILVSYGVLILILTIFGYTFVGVRAKREKDIALSLVLLIWSLRAAIDPQLFLLWFNPFLFIIFGGFFYHRKEHDDFSYLRI